MTNIENYLEQFDFTQDSIYKDVAKAIFYARMNNDIKVLNDALHDIINYNPNVDCTFCRGHSCTECLVNNTCDNVRLRPGKKELVYKQNRDEVIEALMSAKELIDTNRPKRNNVWYLSVVSSRLTRGYCPCSQSACDYCIGFYICQGDILADNKELEIRLFRKGAELLRDILKRNVKPIDLIEETSYMGRFLESNLLDIQGLDKHEVVTLSATLERLYHITQGSVGPVVDND